MPTGFELIKQQVETKKLGEKLPIVGWFHFPLADAVADDFYAETVNTATAGHWDLIKIMTCGNYMPVAYGADYEFSTNPQKWDGVFHSHPITSAEDAGKLGVLDATNDTLAAEVAVDGRIVDTYKGEKPVLATLFDPLSWVQELSTPMNPDWTLELMRSDRLHYLAEKAVEDGENGPLHQAIRKCGLYHADVRFAPFTSMDDFDEVFQSEPAKSVFEMETIEKDEDTLSIDFHYCPLVEAWKKLGLPQDEISALCDIAMDGDRGIIEGLGCLKFDLPKTIANGDDVCQIRISRK